MKHKKYKRRTQEDKARLRKLFIEKCCFKKNPISTEDVFTILGLDYSNSNEQQFGYNLISKWVSNTIDKYWDFSITGVDVAFMERKYHEFLEKCWLEKNPFGYFVDGFYYTPANYVQWNDILNRIFISHFIGARTSLQNMANKGMLINSKVPAHQLLRSVNNYVKLMDMCNDDSKEVLIDKLLTLNNEFNSDFYDSLSKEPEEDEN